MGFAQPITTASTATCFHAGVLCNCMPNGTTNRMYPPTYPTYPRVISYSAVYEGIRFDAPRSRRARELADLQESVRKEHRDLQRGRFAQALEGRIAEQQREKQAMLDKSSRRRAAPATTKRSDTRRLQTYQAAMDMRMLRR